MKIKRLLIFTAIFACASVAHGELSNEYLADWYGDAGSSYYGWDNFSQANTVNEILDKGKNLYDYGKKKIQNQIYYPGFFIVGGIKKWVTEILVMTAI